VTTLVLDPVGGIAGDMTIAALLHLGAPRGALDDGLRKLSLPGVHLEVSEVEISGIRAAHVEVRAPLEAHPHRPFRDIRDLISKAALPRRASELSQSAFALLAAAEGRIHGILPEEVEFHEVGAVDSIVDVVGAALLVDALAPDRIVALPPPSGGGTGRSAHGVIPLPAPATLELLRGRALRPSGPGERTTPTGAALLAAWTEEAAALPELAVDRIGYGAGTRRWEDAPNLLRAILGRSGEAERELVWVLEANLDDLSPQLVSVALDAALSAFRAAR
jgi:pyridinium-3,5-bisthiocarboxylic acid mononucleotide nickel chelatase